MLGNPRHIHFLLLPDFPLYALMPAADALRIANQNAGEKLYDWTFVSAAGGAVPASNGMAVEDTVAISKALLPDCVIVCGGNEPTAHLSRPLLSWIRRIAAHGAVLGALDTGAFALAEAGVLSGFRVTLHWEAMPVFRDAYPDIEVVEQIFVLDRDRWTAAGGTASLDMMLALIVRAHGEDLGQIVANGFVHGQPRPAETPQRLGGVASSVDQAQFKRAVALMADTIAFPLSVDALSNRLGMSRRQFERLFKLHSGKTPAAFYLEMRVEAARDHLFYSAHSISHIAEVTGFQSHAHFCRAFKAHFQDAPTAVRRRFESQQRMRFHPAGSRLTPPLPRERFAPDAPEPRP
jgi:AraC family carnitine catabolism transcriptional activator